MGNTYTGINFNTMFVQFFFFVIAFSYLQVYGDCSIRVLDIHFCFTFICPKSLVLSRVGVGNIPKFSSTAMCFSIPNN